MDLAARASLRHFGRHPWQLGLAALGIALGVSLAVGIDVGTASVSRAFALSSQAVTGKATHEILGGPSGVPEILYRDLRLLPDLPAGLALAPIVEGTAAPEAGGGVLRILGIDPIAEGPFRGTPGADLSPRSDTLAALLTRPGTAVLSAETAAALGVGKGGRLAIRAGGRRASLEVVDVAHAATPDQRRALEWVALVDIATAQELLGITARLSRIDVIVSPVSPADGEPAALGWLAAHIPGTAYVTPVAVRAGALAQLTRAFDLNLRALSLLGLLVGAFLVYNTMSFSVVQRRRSLAILRTLGATRAQLGRNLLVEALALGIGGSALGVLLGLGLSRGLVRLIARAVSDLYFAVSVIDAPTPVAPLARGFVLGVLAALGSAWPAARDATATEPGIALHRSHAEARARTRTTRLAGASVALGAAAAGALALSGRSLTLGLGALVVLMVGCAGLVPAFVLGASRAGAVVLGAARGVTGRLASRSLGAGISRTGVAAAALTLALSVTTGLGVMVASFRGAVERWLGDTLRADVYVSAPSAVGARADSPLPPSLLGRVGAIAGVAQVATNRIVSVRANGTPTSLMAIGLPAGRAPAGEILQGSAPAALAGFANGDGILVSEPLAWKRGIRVGDKVALATDRGTHCLLYTSPSPRDSTSSRMPSSA